MERRRLLTFIVASTAFFLVYISLRTMFVPPMPPPAVVADGDGDGEQLDQDVADPAQDLDPAQDPDPAQGDADTSTGNDAEVQSPSDDPVDPRPAQPEWITLGSMDPIARQYMLITLNTRGAGVERIELTERDEAGELKYQRVDVRSGYLGYLAGQAATDVDGVHVRVVGPGTPADLAGIQVGDVIVSLAGQPTRTRDDLDAALIETKPGDTVPVELIRGGAAQPRVLEVTLSHHPLDVVRLAKDGGADEILGNLSRLSCLMTLSQINRKSIPPSGEAIPGVANPTELIWNSEKSQSSELETVSFSLQLTAAEMEAAGGQPVRLARSYTLAPESYTVDMAVQVENLGDQPQDLAYRLEGANGITLEGWWYSNKISPHFSGAAARDVIYKTTADGHELISGYDLLKRAGKEAKDPWLTIFAPDGDASSRDLKYIGVDAQYFAVAYIPPTGDAAFDQFRRASASIAADADEVPRHKERAVNVTYSLDSEIAEVPAGGTMGQRLQLFAGPKKPELLAAHGLSDSIYYGWFAPFAKALAWLLHILSGVGNYALAIILLTVIVRAAMFPLSRKAAINAQKMQELAPELKKITEKHKDDLEARMKAQRELQQRVGFNPMAGCLPMFLQLPIFIGLYRALSVDIELRQQPVSRATDWASNLAGPDMFAYWGDWMWDYLGGRGTGWLGPYFNLLPVIVVVLFLLQQKMFMPPATDEQTAMTQKMMNIMTLMMGLFFFRVPAGLCIYFITSSLWGICERVFVKKTLPQKAHFDLAALDTAGAPAPVKSQTLAERLRSQVSKPEPVFERPNRRKRPKKK